MNPLRFDNPAAITHSWILSSPSREDGLRKAREIACAAVCLAGHDVPCGVCRGCKKALAGIHPDIITVRRLADRSGGLRRELTVSQIREISIEAQVLPNEAERKVFIIEEAELMNLNAQNAALKLLEEPPSTAVLILCVSNPGLLLETVRSRCALLTLGGEGDRPDDDAKKLADAFLRAVSTGNRETLWRWIAKNEISKLDQTSAFLDAAMLGAADMLCCRSPGGALSALQQMRLYRLLEQCSEYIRRNVNAKHIFSLLATEALSDMGETE